MTLTSFSCAGRFTEYDVRYVSVSSVSGSLPYPTYATLNDQQISRFYKKELGADWDRTFVIWVGPNDAEMPAQARKEKGAYRDGPLADTLSTNIYILYVHIIDVSGYVFGGPRLMRAIVSSIKLSIYSHVAMQLCSSRGASLSRERTFPTPPCYTGRSWPGAN